VKEFDEVCWVNAGWSSSEAVGDVDERVPLRLFFTSGSRVKDFD